MKEQDYKTTALSRLTDRHRSDEVFLAILDTLVEIKEERQQQYLDIADAFLDIDKSEGKNLDLIGKLIGEERTLVNFIDRAYFGFLGARLSESYDIGYWYSLYKNKYGTLRTLTDEEYRRVLKARVVKNSSDNNRNSFIEVLNILSGNDNSSIIENYNNTAITVNVEDVDGLVSYYLSKYKSDRNLIPVPLGRRLNVNHITPSNGGDVLVSTDIDYSVLYYSWNEKMGGHLDTRTSLTNPPRNIEVGWDRSSSDLTYLEWAGDNSGQAHYESVLINLKDIKADFPNSDKISVMLKAFWYDTSLDGNFVLSYKSFKGGSMTPNGYSYENTGGVLVDSSSYLCDTDSQDHSGDLIGFLNFDLLNNKGSLSFVRDPTPLVSAPSNLRAIITY